MNNEYMYQDQKTEKLTGHALFMAKATKSRNKMHEAIFDKTGKYTDEQVEKIIFNHMSKYGFLEADDYEDGYE